MLEKIRSYGMTLTYVNGRMVDADAGDAEDAEDASDGCHDAHVNKVNRVNNLRDYLPCAARSAGNWALIDCVSTSANHFRFRCLMDSGQSRPEVSPASNRNSTAGISELKKKLPVQKHQLPQHPQHPKPHAKPPRIVSCLPKSGSERRRHSSGDSSASSGVSSASAGSDHSAHSSPFSSLKRHASSAAGRKHPPAPQELERPLSPPPRNDSGIRKSLGSSPFGLYSVVYHFHRLPTGASTCL